MDLYIHETLLGAEVESLYYPQNWSEVESLYYSKGISWSQNGLENWSEVEPSYIIETMIRLARYRYKFDLPVEDLYIIERFDQKSNLYVIERFDQKSNLYVIDRFDQKSNLYIIERFDQKSNLYIIERLIRSRISILSIEEEKLDQMLNQYQKRSSSPLSRKITNPASLSIFLPRLTQKSYNKFP